MAKNITIGSTNFSNVNKLKVKETGTENYIDFLETSDANAVASDIISGKTAYVNGNKITGTLEVSSGGYDVVVINDGGGNSIKMLVKFSDGKGLQVHFPFSLPNTTYDDIHLKNVVWLKVLSYDVVWGNSTGITEAQATNSAGYTLTENVTIELRD